MAIMTSALAILIGLTLVVGRNGDSMNPRFIATRYTVPSSPMNVELIVVSKSSLGILWAPPVSNGMSRMPRMYAVLASIE